MLSGIVLNTKLWAVVGGVALGLMAVLLILGRILESKLKSDSVAFSKARFFMIGSLLFLAFAAIFSFVPLALHLVLSFQFKIGNASVPFIVFVIRNQAKIVLAMWAILFLGALISLLGFWKDKSGFQRNT